MTRSICVSILAALALGLAAPGAYAQTKGPSKKPAPAPAARVPAPAPAPVSSGGVGDGDTELNFFGNLSDDGTTSQLLLGVGFGKYLTDSLELKLTQLIIFLDAGAFNYTLYSPYVSAEYQIRPNPGAPFVAYVGGGLGMTLGGNNDIFTYSLFLTPVGGVKYFLNERVSLTYSLSYQFPLVEESCNAFDCITSETTTLQNTLGFSIYY